MEDCKISVITVVFNGVQHIEQTIQSVLQQDYSNVEYIIIDGGSNDGTLDIIKKYEEHLAYWISEKDTGMYSAMNKGWKKASGDIIAMLNADDYYLQGALSKVAKQFITIPDVVYGNITKLKYLNKKQHFREEFPNLHIMERAMGIFHPSTFVTRKVYLEMQGYNEDYKLSADYDFVLRIFKAGYKFKYINESTTVFRLGGVSNTNCNSYKEGYQILLKNGSGYSRFMKIAIYRCYFKKIYKGIIRSIVSAFGMQTLLDKRIEKKWS